MKNDIGGLGRMLSFLCVTLLVFIFSINANALITPVTVSPVKAQILTSTVVNFSWKSVAKATNYEISIAKSTDSSFNSPVHDKVYSSLSSNITLTNGSYLWIVRSKNSKSVSPWSTPVSFSVNNTTASPSPIPTFEKAMWTWYDSDVATATLQSQLLNFASQKGITTVFIHSESLLKDSPAILADFINAAAAKNISVELLFGAPEWALTANHSVPLDLVSRCNSFVNGLTGAKPKGLHFDIEPHGLPTWATDSVNLGSQLIDLYGKIRQAALPTLYINSDIAMGYEYVSITRNGETKTLSQWLVDTTDRTTLMSYRDYALGEDSITSHANHPFTYALTKGKKVMTGVETECLQDPPKVSFCEEGNAFMESEIAKIKNYYIGNTAFTGVGIHHYRPYKLIIP